MSIGWYRKLKEQVGEVEAKRRQRDQANRWNAEHREQQRETQRNRIAKNREMSRKRRREWAAEHKEQEAAAQRRRNAAHPEKYKARRAARYAIETGRLVRPERCQECGEPAKVQMHHPDYSKPLMVEWKGGTE